LTDISYAVPSTEDANLLPQNVAKKMGFFANHGLNADIVLVQGGPNAIAAIQANSVAAGVTSTPLLFNALSQGAQVVAVAEEVEGFSMQLIVSSKLASERKMTLTTSTDTMLDYAKGLKVGGQTPGATTTSMFQGVIKTAGKPADWTVPGNTGTSTASLAALQNGVVDAIIASPPAGQIAEAGGYGKIVWNSLSIEQFRALAYGITLMNPAWADSHQQVAEGIVAALDDAQRWVQANPGPAAEIATSLFPALPAQQMAAILKDMNYAKMARISEASMKAAQNLANTFSLTTAPVSDELAARAWTAKYSKT
jgi:ABC-type nitrate/sulfonate/bicarbonate transport system substrate-binding protein